MSKVNDIIRANSSKPTQATTEPKGSTKHYRGRYQYKKAVAALERNSKAVILHKGKLSKPKDGYTHYIHYSLT